MKTLILIVLLSSFAFGQSAKPKKVDKIKADAAVQQMELDVWQQTFIANELQIQTVKTKIAEQEESIKRLELEIQLLQRDRKLKLKLIQALIAIMY